MIFTDFFQQKSLGIKFFFGAIWDTLIEGMMYIEFISLLSNSISLVTRA